MSFAYLAVDPNYFGLVTRQILSEAQIDKLQRWLEEWQGSLFGTDHPEYSRTCSPAFQSVA